MLADIVVDTNVLMHANNPTESRFEHSRELLLRLLSGTAELCVDAGKRDSGIYSSLIMSEYLEHLVPGSLGYVTLTTLASNLRLKQVSAKISQKEKKWLDQRVPDPRDKTFVRVARNTVAAVLTSHDFLHFPAARRKDFEAQLGVVINTAGDVCTLI